MLGSVSLNGSTKELFVLPNIEVFSCFATNAILSANELFMVGEAHRSSVSDISNSNRRRPPTLGVFEAHQVETSTFSEWS